MLRSNNFLFQLALDWAEKSVEWTAVYSKWVLVLHATGCTGGFTRDGPLLSIEQTVHRCFYQPIVTEAMSTFNTCSITLH